MIVEVALNLPLQKTFDYAWPEGLDVDPVPGLRVLVPFARRKMGGVITALKKHSDFSPLKKVEKTIEEDPSMTGESWNSAVGWLPIIFADGEKF